MSRVTMEGSFPTPEAVRAVLIAESTIAVREACDALTAAWIEQAHARPGRVDAPQVISTGAKVIGIVSSRDPVLKFLERGTGMFSTSRKTPRHLIVPKRKKAMKFSTGGFAKSTRGMKPRRPLRKAKVEVRAEVSVFYERAGQRVAARVAAITGRRI